MSKVARFYLTLLSFASEICPTALNNHKFTNTKSSKFKQIGVFLF
ncbi:hypothetical protein HPS_1102 [Glaesserella parasuis 29755]|uniref:Uncharacterized protein n=1 Tax=Glaesserella parasuis serovar 5 (strain SH0165) TaxID=557723 RepID=B8F753_GLAP5|nr:hypothetical protein HAPS_1604 [Glaesserella parasuis SH0165]EQA00433.1 hypothetical protein HPSNAG_1488 [Glaesserella parasuis str. Nagasaki]EQA95348.1 hypothetical protein HPS_1102 [Glaesserella parasuis 29755]